MMVNSPEVTSTEDFALLRTFLQEFRPSLLITTSDARKAEAMSLLLSSCASPILHCTLPDGLMLPDPRTRTLLLTQVDAMTTTQQLALFDWLSGGRGGLQVVSLATTRLDESVRDGRFLAGLFYRLNVVRLDLA